MGFDELWPGGPRFLVPDKAFRLGTDSVLLAHFAKTTGKKNIIDLCSGIGVLAVLCAHKEPAAYIDAAELSDVAAEACAENLRENGVLKFNVTLGNIREHRELFTAGAYDLVLCNPPYFPKNSGMLSPKPERAAARAEISCTLTDVCETAAYLCKWGGSFALVHRPERLSEVFCKMTKHGIEPKRLRLVQNKFDSAPSLALIEGKRGSAPGLFIEPPLILTGVDGKESDEVMMMYHRGKYA